MAQFTTADLEQLAARGISPETVEAQLERFRTGFPYLRIDSPSAMGCGITPVDEATADACVARWERFLADGATCSNSCRLRERRRVCSRLCSRL